VVCWEGREGFVVVGGEMMVGLAFERLRWVVDCVLRYWEARDLDALGGFGCLRWSWGLGLVLWSFVHGKGSWIFGLCMNL